MATPLPVKFRVRIEDGQVIQNDSVIAHISRGPEVYINAFPMREFVARFKYMRPTAKAKKFVKTVFSRLTMTEYLAMYRASTDVTPLDVEARCEGYDSAQA